MRERPVVSSSGMRCKYERAPSTGMTHPVCRARVVALTSLPHAGQLQVARTTSAPVRRALAANPFTAGDIIDRLTADPDTTTARRAVARTHDPEIIARYAKKSPGTPAPYRNPNAPVALLTAALTSPVGAVRLAAMLNPSTPRDLVRQHLTLAEARDLTDVGSSLGERVVRAHELVIANPWMLDHAGAWTPNLRRALANLPQLAPEHAAEIRQAGWSGWESHKRHPIHLGHDLTRMTVAELLAAESCATDLELCRRPDLTLIAAHTVIRRETRPAEPHIIARLATRFGAAAVTLPHQLAGTRIRSAAWSAPIVAEAATVDDHTLTDAQHAVTHLGDDERAWEAFWALIPDWHLPLVELARSGKTL
jgi:hypothetical protein